jgi:hypothetical protein
LKTISFSTSIEMTSTPFRERVLKNAATKLAMDDFNVDNALDVLKLLIQLSDKYYTLSGKQKKQLVISVFEDLASGPDGILGTGDDLLPQYVVYSMRVMIESNLVESTIDLIYEVVPHFVPRLMRKTFKFFYYLSQCCCCCRCRPRESPDREPLLVTG